MPLEKFDVKNNRHLAIDTDEIIALDFNESMKEIRIHLRGSGMLVVEGKKAGKIWKQLSQHLSEFFPIESEEPDSEDFS